MGHATPGCCAACARAALGQCAQHCPLCAGHIRSKHLQLYQAVLCARGNRWGDGPLRYLELLMFLNMTTEVEQLTFVPYLHDKARSCSGHWVKSRAIPCEAVLRGNALGAQANR